MYFFVLEYKGVVYIVNARQFIDHTNYYYTHYYTHYYYYYYYAYYAHS